MAIAIEGTPSYGNTTASTYTAETTGSDRLLLVCVSCEDSGTPDITGVTFGGVTCTQAVTVRSGGATGPYQNASIYYLKQADIPSGAQSAAATFDSDPITTGPIFDFITLSGVDQTTPVDDFASQSRDNSAGTTFATGCVLDTNTNGGLAVALLAHGGSSAIAVSGFSPFTERADAAFGTAYWRWLGTYATDGSSVTWNPTFTSVSFVAGAAAAFKPASGATVAPKAAFYRMLANA